MTDYETVAQAWDNITQAYMEKASTYKWNQEQLNQLHAEFKKQEEDLLQSFGWTVDQFHDRVSAGVR